MITGIIFFFIRQIILNNLGFDPFNPENLECCLIFVCSISSVRYLLCELLLHNIDLMPIGQDGGSTGPGGTDPIPVIHKMNPGSDNTETTGSDNTGTTGSG